MRAWDKESGSTIVPPLLDPGLTGTPSMVAERTVWLKFANSTRSFLAVPSALKVPVITAFGNTVKFVGERITWLAYSCAMFSRLVHQCLEHLQFSR